MTDLTQLCDYNKCSDRIVENQMTKLMESLTYGVSVDEYIDANDDARSSATQIRLSVRWLRTTAMATVPMR